MDEIELKLQMSPAAADLVEMSDLLPGVQEPVLQRSIYFDTPDQMLAAAGISLRIRRAGDARIQTVKAAGTSAAGLFARPEWEKPVEGDLPDLDDTTPVQAVLGDEIDQLAQAFVVDVARRTWMITEGDATLEVVLDRGRVTIGDRSSEICEMEIELKSGGPDALFAFARRVNEIAPARLGMLTKAERGYLLSRQIRIAVKAEPVPLTAKMTAGEAFRQIVQSCLRHFRLNEDLLFPGRSPAALHQARVALRRMRSAFSIFRPVLGANDPRVLRDRLRDLAAELGRARDLDVLLQRSKPGPLRERLQAEREAEYDRVEQAIASPATHMLMLDLVEWLSDGPWLTDPGTLDARNLSARDFAADALNRFRRKVRKDGRGLQHLEDEARHELRKDAKKLRYAAEFFVPLFDGKRERSAQKAFLSALGEVQDHLGALNDLATAPLVLERLSLTDDPDASTLLARGRKKELLVAAADAHDDLMDADRYWRQ